MRKALLIVLSFVLILSIAPNAFASGMVGGNNHKQASQILDQKDRTTVTGKADQPDAEIDGRVVGEGEAEIELGSKPKQPAPKPPAESQNREKEEKPKEEEKPKPVVPEKPRPYNAVLQELIKKSTEEGLILDSDPNCVPSENRFCTTHLELVNIMDTQPGNTIRVRRKIYYYHWTFTDVETGSQFTRQTPTGSISLTFSNPSSYTAVVIPWAQFEYGYYETYTEVVERKGPGGVVLSSEVKFHKRWVHVRYNDEWDTSAKKSYNFTISLEDVGKPIDLPKEEYSPPTVIPKDNLVE